jgi:hypothetical protein
MSDNFWDYIDRLINLCVLGEIVYKIVIKFVRKLNLDSSGLDLAAKTIEGRECMVRKKN